MREKGLGRVFPEAICCLCISQDWAEAAELSGGIWTPPSRRGGGENGELRSDRIWGWGEILSPSPLLPAPAVKSRLRGGRWLWQRLLRFPDAFSLASLEDQGQEGLLAASGQPLNTLGSRGWALSIS